MKDEKPLPQITNGDVLNAQRFLSYHSLAFRLNDPPLTLCGFECGRRQETVVLLRRWAPPRQLKLDPPAKGAYRGSEEDNEKEKVLELAEKSAKSRQSAFSLEPLKGGTSPLFLSIN
jgi:hypothetical protein